MLKIILHLGQNIHGIKKLVVITVVLNKYSTDPYVHLIPRQTIPQGIKNDGKTRKKAIEV